VSRPYTGANNGRRTHFIQPDAKGICRKKVRVGKSGDRICLQSRDGDRHFHYACTIDPECGVKSWSLEARGHHERLEHPYE
jgi:hypothetical protein